MCGKIRDFNLANSTVLFLRSMPFQMMHRHLFNTHTREFTPPLWTFVLRPDVKGELQLVCEGRRIKAVRVFTPDRVIRRGRGSVTPSTRMTTAPTSSIPLPSGTQVSILLLALIIRMTTPLSLLAVKILPSRPARPLTRGRLVGFLFRVRVIFVRVFRIGLNFLHSAHCFPDR